MAEQMVNGVSTTLNGSINSSVTTFVITTTTGFPTSGDYRVRVGTEIMKVTGRSSSTLTVVRGVDGTTAAAHLSGDVIAIVMSAEGLYAFVGSFNLRGTFANRPAAGIAGRTYKSTDSPYSYIDNGTSWDAFFMGFPVKPPQSTDFTWLNQGGASVDYTKDGAILTVPGNSGDSMRIQAMAVPATPYIIDLGVVITQPPGQQYTADGLCVIDSVANTTKNWALVGQLNYTASVDHFSGYASYAGQEYRQGVYCVGQVFFLRITDDATNRKFWMSLDGQNIIEIYSEASNTHVTPDKIGFFADAQQTGTGHKTWFVHFNVH